jgi:hypothetical protein
VEELNATRSGLAADAADAAALLKALVVRAEDARLLGDMAGMRRAYRQLYDLNRCEGLGGRRWPQNCAECASPSTASW